MRQWLIAAGVVIAMALAYLAGSRLHEPADAGLSADRSATVPVSQPPARTQSPSMDAPPVPASAASLPASAATPAAEAPPAEQGFGFQEVQQLAQERAAKPYENRSPKLPTAIANLSFDQYQAIHFKHSDALWRNQSLFEVQFFHRGFNFDRRVNISEVVDGQARPIIYNPNWFDFGRVVRQPGKLPRSLGFAGFRVHYPLQTPTYKDELIVFLGATFFRVLGRNQDYGLTARGLAINTGSKGGEEFPWFTDFWLVRPTGPEQRVLTLYALLDSDSVTGAYRFDVRPGGITQLEVHSVLFPRKSIHKLGIAPMTSMFLYGEDPAGHRFNDYRPEVHDSDGLMMQTGIGEWLWRPLTNPKDLRINRFMDEHPRGFGLIQRDRDFNHYQDEDARFQRRPSYWIQPLGDWGRGGVELVEIPNGEDIHDNIAAYWVPEQAVEAGKPLHFDWLMLAHGDSQQWPPGGKVIATRTLPATPAEVQSTAHSDARRILIDFAGGDLDGLNDSQPLKALLTANGGQVQDVTVQKLVETGSWRVSFLVFPTHQHDTVDLHCYLQLYGESLTETWTDQLPL